METRQKTAHVERLPAGTERVWMPPSRSAQVIGALSEKLARPQRVTNFVQTVRHKLAGIWNVHGC